MNIPGRQGGDRPAQRPPQDYLAAEDADELGLKAAQQVDRGLEVDWYEAHGTDVDLAALTLCRLRRAKAGLGGGPRYGDDAVRLALEQASPEAVVWLASRTISYLDETGFPDAVAPWFPDDVSPR
jgi:hypothetical protein